MWQACARLDLPVSIHSGDPKAFWLPVDKNNERFDELGEHPDWAFGGGKYPSREEILRQLEQVVASNPQVTFVGVHFGNDPEDVDHVARCSASTPTTTPTSPPASPRSAARTRTSCASCSSSSRPHPVRQRLHGVR